MSRNRKKKLVAAKQDMQIMEPIQPPKRGLVAKTNNQQTVIDSINTNTITFCEGPAGSGKTTISIGMAINYLRRKIVTKIILSRPIMQVDEDLGYLPGTADEKLHPFLLPIMDELRNYANKIEVDNWRKDGTIEVVPLALMRGRNFHNSFIIVDEAQNCTYKQLQMALTRTGRESIMVINGDSAQTDLYKTKQGGLTYYMRALQGLESIGVVQLTNDDVIRNPLISKMLDRLAIYGRLNPIPGNN